MAEYYLSSACGNGDGAHKVGEQVEKIESLCSTYGDKLKLLGCGVIVCAGPKPDGSCGAICQEGPIVEAQDLSVTFQHPAQA